MAYPEDYRQKGRRKLREIYLPTEMQCFSAESIEALGSELIRIGSIFRLNPMQAKASGLSAAAFAAISGILASEGKIESTGIKVQYATSPERDREAATHDDDEAYFLHVGQASSIPEPGLSFTVKFFLKF